MSILFACPRCATAAGHDDRFCGSCGLRRPLVPGPPGAPVPVGGPALHVAPVAPAPAVAAAPPPVTPVPARPGPSTAARAAGLTFSAIGMTFRLINGLLTIVSGIAIAVLAHQHLGEDKAGWILAGGIGWALYGAYIVLTRRSYWVSSLFTYVVPIFVLVYLTHGGSP